MVVCFSAQFCSHRRTDETEHTAACQSAEGHQRPEMCIRHFTSQALRLTWSRSTHPPLTCHPSTHLSPLYAASPPSLPPSQPHPAFLICLFGDAQFLPGLFVFHGERLELEKVQVCVSGKLLFWPEWALKLFLKRRR